MPHDNFFNHYFRFVEIDAGECPANCHRWSAISALSAWLGKQVWMPFGHSIIYPNQYIQIIGLPASKKSTAIKISNNLLKLAGFKNFAPKKTSMEKFLVELHDLTWGNEDEDGSSLLEDNLFGNENPKERAASLAIAESYIASDEFANFIGYNNLNFISLLGEFWDIDEVYDYKLKNSKAVYINRPTINILAGNTPTGFNQAFPPDVQGQGFFSRLLLIHAKSSGRKIEEPGSPSEEHTRIVLEYLGAIKKHCVGLITMTPRAKELMAQIYHTWEPLIDQRFEAYSGRRCVHLRKLAIICAAARISTQIDEQDVVLANTLLTFAEYSMPKAMGEFGKGRHSTAAHKILEIIDAAHEPVSMIQLIKHVHNDVDSLSAVTEIVRGLVFAEKLQVINGNFAPKRAARIFQDTELVKPSWLLAEEIE